MDGVDWAQDVKSSLTWDIESSLDKFVFISLLALKPKLCEQDMYAYDTNRPNYLIMGLIFYFHFHE